LHLSVALERELDGGHGGEDVVLVEGQGHGGALGDGDHLAHLPGLLVAGVRGRERATGESDGSETGVSESKMKWAERGGGMRQERDTVKCEDGEAKGRKGFQSYVITKDRGSGMC
jgi:hypothetical protein